MISAANDAPSPIESEMKEEVSSEHTHFRACGLEPAGNWIKIFVVLGVLAAVKFRAKSAVAEADRPVAARVA